MLMLKCFTVMKSSPELHANAQQYSKKKKNPMGNIAQMRKYINSNIYTYTHTVQTQRHPPTQIHSRRNI